MSDTPRRYIPATKVPPTVTKEPTQPPDLTNLLTRTLDILEREIANLNQESCNRKLAKDSSTALVSYIKLLNELQTKEKELLEEMNEAQLQSDTKGT